MLTSESERIPMTLTRRSLLVSAAAVPLARALGPLRGLAQEEVGNNLSVPAIFVGAPPFTLANTTGDPVDPDDVATNATTYFGTPLPPAPAGNYYLQGEDTWQASYLAATTAAVTAAWGDNLTNAPLKQGTPIRVEMGLLADAPPAMTGFEVVKLTDELDRYATYGTLGNAVTPYGEVRVWDAQASLQIYRLADNLVVYSGPFAAEINATGRVVYGFNWQKPVQGTYTIVFSAPQVTITGADAGTVAADGKSVTLQVVVATRAGGGGKGGGGGNGGGGGGGPKGPRTATAETKRRPTTKRRRPAKRRPTTKRRRPAKRRPTTKVQRRPAARR
jgi:hypothetical protein